MYFLGQPWVDEDFKRQAGGVLLLSQLVSAMPFDGTEICGVGQFTSVWALCLRMCFSGCSPTEIERKSRWAGVTCYLHLLTIVIPETASSPNFQEFS